MLHHHRRFGVITVQSVGELVDNLTEHIWTLCTGFSRQGLFFLNDSFPGDGAQEYRGLRELPGSSAGGYGFSLGTSFGGVPPSGPPESLLLREWRCFCRWGSSSNSRQLRKTAAGETKTP